MLVRILSAAFLFLASKVLAAPTEKQSGLRVVSECTVPGQVALTFDDGPYRWETDIAAMLNSTGSKGTFFLNGNNWGCIYDHVQLIRDLYAQNHTLASHTWSHPNLVNLNEAQIHWELEQLETAFIRILGVKPLLFRPPFGSYDSKVLNVLAQRGYKKLLMWTDDCQDAMGANLGQQNGVMDSVARSFPSPKMLLQHSVMDSSVDVTRYGIGRLREAGYKLVTVDTCLGDDGEFPYEIVGKPGQPGDSWRC